MKLPFELQAGEQVLLFTRRHWMSFVPKIVGIVLAGAAAPIAFTWLLRATVGLGATTWKVAFAVDALWLAFWAVRGYFFWFRYQNDIWVVTNQRVVDSVKRNWINHTMASADLVDIQDMAVHRNGLLATTFNYGDVRCQTAGEMENFILAGIPQPAKVLELVDASRDSARKELLRIPGRP